MNSHHTSAPYPVLSGQPIPDLDATQPTSLAALESLLAQHLDALAFNASPGFAVFGLASGLPHLILPSSSPSNSNPLGGRPEIDPAALTPEQALMGFRLDSAFDTIAIIADSIMGSAGSHNQACIAFAQHRQGASRGIVVSADHSMIGVAQAKGWLVDACLRCLELPTPANRRPLLDLAETIWLDRMLTSLMANAGTSELDWPQATQMCPIPSVLTTSCPQMLGERLALCLPSWPELRRSCIDGLPCPVWVDARWAAWMDDHMFARWCFGAFPDSAALHADFELLCSFDVADRVNESMTSARALP